MPGFDFEADTRQCPKCQSTDPDRVIELVTHHFVVCDRAWMQAHGIYEPFVACGVEIAGMDKYLTGEPWLVTCPACQATSAFQDLNRPSPALAAADLKPPTPVVTCCGDVAEMAPKPSESKE